MTSTVRTKQIFDTCSILRLLQPRKGHLGARDVLFRVLEVLEQRVLPPSDALGPVGFCVLVLGQAARLPPKQAPQIGPEFIRATLHTKLLNMG